MYANEYANTNETHGVIFNRNISFSEIRVSMFALLYIYRIYQRIYRYHKVKFKIFVFNSVFGMEPKRKKKEKNRERLIEKFVCLIKL